MGSVDVKFGDLLLVTVFWKNTVFTSQNFKLLFVALAIFLNKALIHPIVFSGSCRVDGQKAKGHSTLCDERDVAQASEHDRIEQGDSVES